MTVKINIFFMDPLIERFVHIELNKVFLPLETHKNCSICTFFHCFGL